MENKSFINFFYKKTVFNYLDVLFLKSENVNVVEVTSSSTIGSFTLWTPFVCEASSLI